MKAAFIFLAVVVASAGALPGFQTLDPSVFPYCGNDLSVAPAPYTKEQATLKQVNVLIRHGDRTLWSGGECWPNDSAVYECSDETQLMKTKSTTASLKYMFNKVYMKNRNVLPGNCMLAQLTHRGFSQHIANGQALREAYIEKAGLLPNRIDDSSASSFFLRSDDCPRTLQSGQALFTGMYPDNMADLTLVTWNTMDQDTENMEINTKICPRYTTVLADAKKSPVFQQFLSKVFNPLQVEVRTKLGVKEDNLQHTMDCFYNHICHNKPVPSAVDESLVKRVTEANAFVENYPITYPDGAKYALGLFIGEVLENMAPAATHESNHGSYAKFTLYSGHDTGPMMPFLTATGAIAKTEWAPYASNAILEVYELANGGHTVRLLWQGRPVHMRGCSSVLCKWEEFEAYFKSLTPTVSECNSTGEDHRLEHDSAPRY